MEIILGIDRKLIAHFLLQDFGFIKEEDDNYNYLINNLSSKEREIAEYDSTFKQVIPYLIIQHNDFFLLNKRSKKQSEKRLHEKLSLGIGGHINPIDSSGISDVIVQCLNRELNEEIDIDLVSSPEFLGYINDDVTDVGKVHLGLVFKATSKSRIFYVRETEKMKCEWVDKSYLIQNYEKIETWSQIVIDSLI